MAAEHAGAETIDYEEVDVLRRADEHDRRARARRVHRAVGMEAHAGTARVRLRPREAGDRCSRRTAPIALRQAILACRTGGTVSVIGVYGGFIDKFPIGPVMNRSLTIRTGQCHVQRYMRPLLDRIERGEIDPSFVVIAPPPLDEAPRGYEMFKNKEDSCIKVVLKP